jgi:hypothetical protein
MVIILFLLVSQGSTCSSLFVFIFCGHPTGEENQLASRAGCPPCKMGSVRSGRVKGGVHLKEIFYLCLFPQKYLQGPTILTQNFENIKLNRSRVSKG